MTQKNYKVIYLDEEDKNRFFKIAQQKQLSASCLTEIIIYNLQKVMMAENSTILLKYIHKGSKQIYLKPRNERCFIKANCSLNLIYTNIIYLFLHQEQLTNYLTKADITKSLRAIQSECDKTYDPRFDYNQKIRTEYYLIKKITKEITK